MAQESNRADERENQDDQIMNIVERLEAGARLVHEVLTAETRDEAFDAYASYVKRYGPVPAFDIEGTPRERLEWRANIWRGEVPANDSEHICLALNMAADFGLSLHQLANLCDEVPFRNGRHFLCVVEDAIAILTRLPEGDE